MYHVFLEGYMAEWKPQGATEIQLVTRIAHDNWRLNRAGAIEDNLFAIGSGDIAYARNSDNHAEIEDALTQARTYQKEAKTLQLLSLYEQRTNRNIHKNIQLLKNLQAERQTKEAEQMEEARRRKLRQMLGHPAQAAWRVHFSHLRSIDISNSVQ
jgi:HPt (histidine-containing phosphotransfer) domain-containing protein